MKIKYYLMSMMVAALATTGFTSCDDDDTVIGIQAPPALSLDSEFTRVKIGAENRIAVQAATGAGEYHAYSLNPDIADVVAGENGQFYIEGHHNGITKIVVSDAANQYKQLTVSVYTTDMMTLSHSQYTLYSPMGLSNSSSECSVLSGNGDYTVVSDNSRVEATIDSYTGVITITAVSSKDDFNATLTVTDCTGLSASIDLTISATFDAFTASDIDNLMAKHASELYIKSSKFSINTVEVFPGWEQMGAWEDSTGSDNLHTFGWWLNLWGMDLGGHYIIYPEGTAIDQEVDATYRFSNGYPTYTLQGKAKVIKDDATSKVVIWWFVDMENETIDRGWIVKTK